MTIPALVIPTTTTMTPSVEISGAYRLWYRLRNNGDGSASVVLYNSREEAEKAEEKAIEEGMAPWGESSAGCQDIFVVGGNLVAYEQEWDWKSGANIKRTIVLTKLY